ncbi:MAG TPA: AI-2E family transporter [Gemmatimonadaceae bacterium]|nr:AI-2E family transporter [Gemmatimonadaceae bacterium]
MSTTGVQNSPLSRLLLTVACGVIVLAGVRAAGSVIGPIIIALLLTIAWSPGANWLRRKGWPPTIAALTGIVLGIIFIALFVLLVWTSLSQLQENLPSYQPRIEALRQSVTSLLASAPFDTSRILSAEALQPGAIVGYALTFIKSITATAGGLGVLVLIMAFMMIEAVRYPAKLQDAIASVEDAGDGAKAKRFARLEAFGRTMRSYVVINTVFGLVASAANTVLLLALGVDFAILWGVVSFLLSFLPNIGFLIALVPPALLALVQFGLARALFVVAGFVVINFIVDNILKPRFVGESLDLSPVVVLLSLLFWGWLIGPAGALLSVPLSIAAKFLFESYAETRWMAHLMSDARPASPGAGLLTGELPVPQGDAGERSSDA